LGTHPASKHLASTLSPVTYEAYIETIDISLAQQQKKSGKLFAHFFDNNDCQPGTTSGSLVSHNRTSTMKCTSTMISAKLHKHIIIIIVIDKHDVSPTIAIAINRNF
jgi:hypothetical protein